MVVIVGGWTGPHDEGTRQWQPFLDVAPVAGSFVGPLPYPVLNTLFDESLPKGLQATGRPSSCPPSATRSSRWPSISAKAIPSEQTANHFYAINGAVQRVPKDATAFPYRDADFAAVIAGMWEDPADNEANVRWVREYSGRTAPHSAGGAYINFMDADDQSRIKDNYAGNYARLASIKAKYDPGNLFHINQNIKPAG